MQEEKQNTLKSLSKALNILQLFLNRRNELALGEISNITGLDKTTISRILSTLAKRGYITQREKRGKYFLGTIFINFSDVVKSKLQIRNIALSYLTRLSQKVCEQVMIAYGDNLDNIIVESLPDTHQSNNILTIANTERTGIIPHCTAIGKIFLANMPDAELNTFLKTTTLQRYTSKTITDINELKDQLTQIRQEGTAIDDNEYTLGVTSIAAALRDIEGKLTGCISIAAPSVRLTRAKLRELTPEIKSCAMDISGG